MDNYLVYCIQSTRFPRRSYIGCTNHFHRRLRQHNGELVGGARYTRGGGPWKPVFHVTGLNHKQALQLEWACKKKRVKGVAGIKGRIATLQKVMQLERWTSNSPPLASIEHRLKIYYF